MMRSFGPQHLPRGGARRTRTTVLLAPPLEQAIRQKAREMGVTLADALAYFCARGAGLEVPADVQAEIALGAIEGPNRKLRNQRRSPAAERPHQQVGVRRIRVTARLAPPLEQAIRQKAREMGVTLADALAYFCARGAGLEVPAEVRLEVALGAIEGPNRKLRNQRRSPAAERPLQEELV